MNIEEIAEKIAYSELESLRRQADVAKKLEKYAHHYDRCASKLCVNGEWLRCDCGLAALLAEDGDDDAK